MVIISKNPEHRGKSIRAAYEDVRIAPRSPLLLDLSQVGFVFPRSYAVVDTDNNELATTQHQTDNAESRSQGLPTEDALPASFPWEEGNYVHLPQHDNIHEIRKDGEDSRVIADEDVARYFEEEPTFFSNWKKSLSSANLVRPVREHGTPSDPARQQRTLNKPFDPPRPEKDIGEVRVKPPPALPFELRSMEQDVLRRVKGIIGYKTASEFQLQFVPR